MRRLVLHLAVGTAALFLGASAHAGALTGADLAFSLGGGDSLAFPATGVVGSALSANDVTIEAGGGFAGTVTTPLDSPPATGLTAVVGMNTSGAWSGDPLTGTSIQIDVTSIITGFGGTPLITVPFPAGSPDPIAIDEGGIQIDIFPFATGWTSGVMALTDSQGGAVMTENGADVIATGSVMSGTPGSVTMVTGAYIETSLADPTFTVLTLSMDFESVPEPTMPLLFGAGALVLGAFGLRKRQA